MNEAASVIVLLIFVAIFLGYFVWFIKRRSMQPARAKSSGDGGNGGGFWFVGGNNSGSDGGGGGGDGGGD